MHVQDKQRRGECRPGEAVRGPVKRLRQMHWRKNKKMRLSGSSVAIKTKDLLTVALGGSTFFQDEAKRAQAETCSRHRQWINPNKGSRPIQSHPADQSSCWRWTNSQS
eukprot:463360-Pelagomonas_calceolata.AAC.1